MSSAAGALGAPGAPAAPEPAFPPVASCIVASLAMVVTGGIWMASYFPRRAPLGPPAALWAAAAVLLVTGLALLSRVPGFAWGVFAGVGRWALLAYAVIAGLIGFAFVHNGARGAPLALVTAMLVVFALDVTTAIATTVARYHRPGP